MGIKVDTVDTIEQFENQFKRQNNDDSVPWPTRLTKDKSGLSVRFLTNPEGVWIKYTVYFDPAAKKFIIATEENEDELEARGLKPSGRWLAPAVNIENNEVIVVELNWTLLEAVNALREQYETKFGGITEYDIALKRTGEGKDGTKYFAFLDGQAKIDVNDTERFPIPNGHSNWRDFLWSVAEKLLNFQEGRKETPDVLANDTDPGEDNTDDAPAPTRKVVRRSANSG